MVLSHTSSLHPSLSWKLEVIQASTLGSKEYLQKPRTILFDFARMYPHGSILDCNTWNRRMNVLTVQLCTELSFFKRNCKRNHTIIFETNILKTLTTLWEKQVARIEWKTSWNHYFQPSILVNRWYIFFNNH